MSRDLKRVPLDFDWPIGKVWYGYLIKDCLSEKYSCDDCKHYARLKNLKFTYYGCPNFGVDPPIGDGYQLWETTTEGFPISPVFETLEQLADYCATSCFILGHGMLTANDWLEVFKRWEGFIP